MESPSLEENPDIEDIVEVVLLKNPNNTSFIREQKYDTTLIPCSENAKESPFPLSPEHPERFKVDKNLLYREVLLAPHRGRDGHLS